MKIGISDTMMGNGYGRFGEKKYEKLKEHGYDCLDYNLATTTVGLYPLSETEAETALKHEIQLAKDAGIEICQVHGPWRVPIQDSTKEDRAERMEKMKRSIRFTAFMGCKNWVIHPIMPFNGIIDWQDVAQALKEIQFEGVFSLECHASSKLPDALFEEVSRLYAKVAKEITKNL